MAPSTAVAKLKVALKLSISRLRMSQQKETALAKVARRQMAQLLESGKEESARIRVENIIRQDISVELMEIIELYCELILARIGMMEGKDCDPGLEEAVKSLIYAAPRTEIKELQTVRQILVEKYGKEFALSAIENTDGKVSERVVKKLRVEPPEELLVTLYLKEIARTYTISYQNTPPSTPLHGSSNDKGSYQSMGQASLIHSNDSELSGEFSAKKLRPPINIAPPSPSTDNIRPVIKLPDPPKLISSSRLTPASNPQAPTKGNLDDDDLARRFAALKRL